MRFVVDVMLGKLAKWLRVLGFDAAYGSRAGDRELLQTARRERRVLLTRDHALLRSAKNVRGLLIESDDWRRQLSQVIEALDLRDEARPLSRCLACNIKLKRLSRKNARNLVAPFVFERAASFSICPRCGRVYWPGTHFGDMDGRLSEILGGPAGAPPGRTLARRLEKPYNEK